ncbi:MAG: hypothetical protein RR428_01230 [Coprobacillus sp.]
MLYFFVFSATIFIASRGNLMYENVTGVSLIEQYHLLVVIYTIFLACFFAYKVAFIYKKLSTKKPFVLFFVYLTGFIMSFGALFPYTLNSRDLFSLIHVYCSMFSCISFLVILFIYNRYLTYDNPILYNQIHWLYDLGLQFLCIMFLVFGRVNGYLEIMYAVLVCSYLYILEKNIKKESLIQ